MGTARSRHRRERARVGVEHHAVAASPMACVAQLNQRRAAAPGELRRRSGGVSSRPLLPGSSL